MTEIVHHFCPHGRSDGTAIVTCCGIEVLPFGNTTDADRKALDVTCPTCLNSMALMVEDQLMRRTNTFLAPAIHGGGWMPPESGSMPDSCATCMQRRMGKRIRGFATRFRWGHL